MSIKIMTRVWESSKQKGSALLTLLALADWANDYGSSWYGMKSIAGRTRLSVRNEQRIIAALNETRDLYVCYACSMLDTNIYIVTTAMAGEEIMKSLMHPPFGLNADNAWEIAQSVILRPNDPIRTGGDKMSGVTNPVKNSAKMSPDPSLNTNHQLSGEATRKTKRSKADLDDLFDVIGECYFGVPPQDKEGVKAKADLIVSFRKGILSFYPDIESSELTQVAIWYRSRFPNAEMVTSYKKVKGYIHDYRSITRVTPNGHIAQLDPNDPTLAENDWIKS